MTLEARHAILDALPHQHTPGEVSLSGVTVACLCTACGKPFEPVNNWHEDSPSEPFAATLPGNAIACLKVICSERKGC